VHRISEEEMETSDSSPVPTEGPDSASASRPQPAPPADERIQKLLDKALYAGGSPVAQQVRNFLNGTWLGEPLHVAVKDLPIGAWTVAILFDVLDLAFDRRSFALAADASVAVGLLGAAGAAATGATDWSDVDPPVRRLGFTHGLLNLGGAALFASSLLLRRKRARASARVVAGLGYGLMAYASHLGGRMVFRHRVGVDRTDGLPFPNEFVAVLPEAELADEKPTRAVHEGVPILLVRRGNRIFALAETCSHFSGPLSEGKLEGNSIVCPYHFSRFDLEDGHVINGPAVHPQPCLEVRTHNGQIEVRRSR
jgi:nitrite reductase/ring-hydroxylating ferredoxin subunit/uncharacterized membrane protein